MVRVGILSDTHGLLREQAVAALSGSDLLLHAGDVGAPEVLEHLQRMAPLHAVRGNVDEGPWALDLPLARSLDLEGVTLLLHHGHVEPPRDEAAAAHVIVRGHSHQPRIEHRDGALHVNPGSAGPRRFRLPVTVARLRIDGDGVHPELLDV